MAQNWHAGRRRKSRGVLNLRVILFAGNSERQSFVRCTVLGIQRRPGALGRAEGGPYRSDLKSSNFIFTYKLGARGREQETGLPKFPMPAAGGSSEIYLSPFVCSARPRRSSIINFSCRAREYFPVYMLYARDTEGRPPPESSKKNY
ncbi:hypothetical protein EVAR_27692_1 [Eumeta japonica]|uniref:Uncharacterized protein n=1 Tax=Eumeta variegata TaxID=151549 RepID=A0A4C1WPG0_EUMVA|nr:hypothetical protein EVAR_27692_1 [Eumeta japonica]